MTYAQVLVIIGVLSAAAVIYWNSFPWLFVLVIFVGALSTLAWNWKKDMALKVWGKSGGRQGSKGHP